jgi:hypothetical protein
MNKRILTIGGIVALALLLAGAAFVGGQLLSGQGMPARSLSELRDIPAEELPQTPADLVGSFDHRQDQSIFVRREDKHSLATSTIAYQVVVTSQTKIYRDVTEQQYEHVQLTGQARQQVVEPGSLDEIGERSLILVWGTRTGDRILAEILVFTDPPISKPK